MKKALIYISVGSGYICYKVKYNEKSNNTLGYITFYDVVGEKWVGGSGPPTLITLSELRIPIVGTIIELINEEEIR